MKAHIARALFIISSFSCALHASETASPKLPDTINVLMRNNNTVKVFTLTAQPETTVQMAVIQGLQEQAKKDGTPTKTIAIEFIKAGKLLVASPKTTMQDVLDAKIDLAKQGLYVWGTCYTDSPDDLRKLLIGQ